MSVRYALKESISGFTSAKLATVISIVTIGISLLLLGVFTVLTINASRFIDALRDLVAMEAFLQEPVTDTKVRELRRAIAGTAGVDTVIYISKDDAAKIFRQEFGKDIADVLDFNPFPPSFRIKLKHSHQTAEKAQSIYSMITGMEGVDSVYYRKTVLEIIDRQAITANNLALGLGTLISLSAVFLVSNTIRLAIYSKRRLLRTMELVGATRMFIRLPFLLEGILQGIIGGALAAGVLYLLLEYATRLLAKDFSEFIRMDPVFYAGVIAGGVVLGLVGSIFSVWRFMKLSHGT
jgi:cell division transport system permease protein